MLRHWLTHASRGAAVATAGLVTAGLVLPAGGASASAASTAASTVSASTVSASTVSAQAAAVKAAGTGAADKVKAVRYRGYTFEVPSSWPVISLSRHPATCVRFDLHAVYLGTPGTNQNCPSWLLGATESVVIEPGPASAQRSSQEDPVSDEVTAQAPGIRLTATFDTDPTSVYRIMSSAGLAAPLITSPNPARLAAAGPAATASAAAGDGASELTVSARSEPDSAQLGITVGYPELPASVANFAGLGFDVCAAPSSSYMSAWRKHSPYGAVGIYIGGSDRACDQQNLTASWVRREAAAGWRFVPMYAGPQASFGQLKSPASQGAAAAEDAVVQAEHFGLGPRTPLYYDMEAYPASLTGEVLRFLSAWTTELHKLGYMSGVYSSSDSAVVDLARQYKKGEFAMPDVIYDALWNGARNLEDSVYESGEWTGGRRVHQFSGDVLQTYGGDTLDIDQDYLDVTLPTPGGTTQDSPGTASSASATLFYRGTDHQLWAETERSAGHWTRTDLGGYLTSAPSSVQVRSDVLDVLYRGRDGWLWERTRDDGRWLAARELTLMGDLGSGPRAVAQPNGVIDVFWKGSHDPHLWHAQYDPHGGWTGPQDLQGKLDGPPYPVETTSGQVQVFWDGTDGELWRTVRGLGESWSGPQDLGMGVLGGPPHAVAQSDGEVDVFWRGSTKPHTVWSAELRPGRRAVGPVRVAGTDSSVGQPWPVLSDGAERVLFRGGDSRMWLVSRAADGGRWGTPVKISRLGVLRTSPVATAGPDSEPLEVFWTNAGRHLVSAPLSVSGSWGSRADLGGSVTQATASG